MKGSVYRNLFILAFGSFAVLNTELGIVGILPQLALETHKSIAQMGYLIGAFALTVTFAGPIFTVFALRFMERKVALIFSQVLLSLTNIMFMTIASYPLLFLARILGGLGHPLFFTLALSYASDYLPLESRGKGTAILFSGVNIAMILGFPLISYLTDIFSYKIGIGFSLLSNLIALAGIIVFIPKSDSSKTKEAPMSFSAFKDKGFIISIPVVTLLFAGMFMMYSYFAPYLRDIWALSPETLTQALFYFGAAGLIGNIALGFVPSKKTGFALGLLVLAFLLVYALLHLRFTVVPLFFIVSLWGFLQSGITLLGQVWFTLNKTTRPEAVNSLLVSGFNLGITLGSLMGGLILSHLGLSALPVAGGLTFLLVLLGIFWDRRNLAKQKMKECYC